MIVAHRGAGHAGPTPATRENTFDAFNKAIEIGADAIELDLRRARNGVIIVHHDPKIGNGDWSIGELPLDEIQQQGRGQGYEIPLFEDVLKLCAGRIALDIELKETGYEREIVELTKKYYDLKNVVFTSFHDLAVRRIKEIDASAVTGLLLGVEPPAGTRRRVREISPQRRIANCRPDIIAPNRRLLRIPVGLQKAGLGLPLMVWTVNDVKFARKLIDRKTAAIITDFPENLLPIVSG